MYSVHPCASRDVGSNNATTIATIRMESMADPPVMRLIMDPCQRQRKPSLAPLEWEGANVVNMSFTLLGSERSRFVFKFGSGFGVPGSVRQMSLRLAVEP